MTNKLLIIIALALLAVSCKKEETNSLPRLKNCELDYLNFGDDPRYFYRNEINFDFSVNEGSGIIYTYKNNKVIKSTGGIAMIDFGKLFVWQFTYDSLVYADNKVMVYSKPFSPYAIPGIEDTSRPTIYEYDKDGRLKTIIRRDESAIKYTYQEDMISEVHQSTNTFRNMYFENGNLVKITRKYENPALNYYSLREILLQDYDSNPNPLKGLFHLPGTFFRAFSDNNYTKISVNDYHSADNVNFELSSSSSYWRTFTYNEAGYPMFGVYE